MLGNGGGVDTERAGLGLPSCAQIGDAEAGLAVAGVDSGFAFHRRVLERRRLPAFTGVEVGELVAHLDTNLVRTFRELLQQTVAEAGDFGLAVHDRLEHHPEPCGDLGSKHGLVEVAEGLLMLLQRQRIQRQPTPIRRLDLRGDHHMGVELRVISPARRLTEHCHRQPTGLGMQTCAVGADTRRRRVLLDHRHRRGDCDVMALGETFVTGEAPQHRQRLRCRQRRVVPGDRSDRVAVLVDTIRQLAPEEHAGVGVVARQECFEAFGRHLARQAESPSLGPGPHTRQLTVSFGEVAGVIDR